MNKTQYIRKDSEASDQLLFNSGKIYFRIMNFL